MAQQQTNFPISNSAFVDANGVLTKQGFTLLRTLWLAGPGAPAQLGWITNTTTANKGPLADYTGGITPANMAAQIALLTEIVGTLINALEAYGILKE